jgi:predicted transcriptional regulator
MNDLKISKKKPAYPISKDLDNYLTKYDRNTNVPLQYDDLLRFSGGIEVFDEDGNDTLWLNVFYTDADREEIYYNLELIYSILLSDGNEEVTKYLDVESIEYCTFGNSKPFRIKIRNTINDNYTYFYVKIADASRIYGLELEDIVSPNFVDYFVKNNTLIEAHIIGVPGDEFIKNKLKDTTKENRNQIAKEFVKFNERCFVRLLGDMRSYNFVFVISQDFDRVQYRIRAIDFDQQSYEGKPNIYKPQFFKENNKLVNLVSKALTQGSIDQYVKEERSAIAKRVLTNAERLKILLDCMKKDTISTPKKINQLKTELFDLTKDVKFKKSKNMGEVLESSIDFVRRNYKSFKHIF